MAANGADSVAINIEGGAPWHGASQLILRKRYGVQRSVHVA
jgi:hypothetical protein